MIFRLTDIVDYKETEGGMTIKKKKINIVIVDSKNSDYDRLIKYWKVNFSEFKIKWIKNESEKIADYPNWGETDFLITDINEVPSEGIQGVDVIVSSSGFHCHLDIIRQSIFDYVVLQPIDFESVKKMSDRMCRRCDEKEAMKLSERADMLLRELLKGKKERLILSTKSEVLFLDESDIIRIEAKGAYSTVYTEEGSIEVTKSMSMMERMVKSDFLSRVHRSHIVNLLRVKRYIRIDGGELEMSNGDRVKTSMNFKEVINKVTQRVAD